MICENCGNQVADGSVFCEFCGAKLSNNNYSKSSEPVEQQVQQPVQQAFVQETPSYQPSAQPVQQVYTQPQPAVYVQPQQPQYQQQQVASQPQPAPAKVVPSEDLYKPISVLGYMLMFLILGVPILGVVMTFIWAFSSNSNKNKKHFSIAILIFWLIGIALSIVLAIALPSMLEDLIDTVMYGF